MALEDLRNNEMMAHLLDSLESGQDIGHYGRLVFAMIARHFIPAEQVAEYLSRDPACPPEKAKALVQQVASRGYNPPRRQRILGWQREQEFPICPETGNPDGCNVYRNLRFPDGVYEDIQEYHEQKAEAASR